MCVCVSPGCPQTPNCGFSLVISHFKIYLIILFYRGKSFFKNLPKEHWWYNMVSRGALVYHV